MKFFQTPSGHLVLQSEPEDNELLENLFSQHGHNETEFLSQLFESTGWQANGHLYQVAPEQVGALTDAPILSDELVIDEDGSVATVGKLWWYPNYMVSSMPEILVRKGQVTFQQAA